MRTRRALSRSVPADHHEITRLGHTLNHMLNRLDASAERQGRFVADASHELRTPLTLIRAELDVALHRPRSAGELTDTLRSVDTEVQRLIDLSNALLDLEELGTSRTSEGSGLGLAFVHGGTAYAENTGRGGRVILELPC